MESLSHLLPGGPISALVPTSQAGGNMQSSSEQAATAPGSEPVDPLPDRASQGDPHVEATAHDRTVVTHADRPVIRMGQWNDLRGA